MEKYEASVQELITTAEQISGKFSQMIETGLSFAPYLGSAMNLIKFNRLEKRLKEHEGLIRKISQLSVDSMLSEKYISEQVFPIVLSDLIEEHEDAKINYILTGFQNVFIEEKSEESLVYHYFDTLRALRYSDLRRFFYHSGLDTMYPSSEDLNNEEVITFTKSIDIKLYNLQLIHIPIRFDDFSGRDHFEKEIRHELLSYGKTFAKFVTSQQLRVG